MNIPPFKYTTMSKTRLREAVAKAVRYPHPHVHKGELLISPRAYQTAGRGTNLVISPYALLDCTGSIHIGPWCNIGPRTRIYTHDTIHLGKEPLSALEEKHGVLWQDKYIGADVWIHDGSIVLYQTTVIPDGFAPVRFSPRIPELMRSGPEFLQKKSVNALIWKIKILYRV
jgi:hypothetical protein